MLWAEKGLVDSCGIRVRRGGSLLGFSTRTPRKRELPWLQSLRLSAATAGLQLPSLVWEHAAKKKQRKGNPLR